MTIGKKYRFGKYTWTLLDIQDGKGLFLLSGLLKERKAFHDTPKAVEWASSDLGRWLRRNWYHDNFTFEQRFKIKIATLLSVEEYQKYHHLIPKVSHWWWLRDSGYHKLLAAFVRRDYLHKNGENITHSLGGVRPALWVELPKGDG